MRGDPAKSGVVRQTSVAVADTLSFANDRFLVTLGLRNQSLAQDNFNVTTGANSGPGWCLSR